MHGFADGTIAQVEVLRVFNNNVVLARDEIGREAATTGRSVRDIVLERGLMDRETLDEVLSLENLVPRHR